MLTPEQIINFFGFCLTAGVGIGGLYLGLRRSLKGKMNALDSDRRVELQELRKDIDDRKDENQTLQRDLDATRRDNRDLKSRIDSLNSSLDSSNAVVRDVDRLNAKLQGHVDEQRKIYGDQLEEQRKQLVQQAGDIALLKTQIIERDTQIASLKRSIEGKDQTLTDANMTINELRIELEAERNTRTELSNEANRKIDDLQTQINALRQQVSDMDEERRRIATERDHALAQVAERDGIIAELTRQLESAQTELDALRLMVTPAPIGVDPPAAPAPEVA